MTERQEGPDPTHARSAQIQVSDSARSEGGLDGHRHERDSRRQQDQTTDEPGREDVCDMNRMGLRREGTGGRVGVWTRGVERCPPRLACFATFVVAEVALAYVSRSETKVVEGATYLPQRDIYLDEKAEQRGQAG